LALSES